MNRIYEIINTATDLKNQLLLRKLIPRDRKLKMLVKVWIRVEAENVRFSFSLVNFRL